MNIETVVALLIAAVAGAIGAGPLWQILFRKNHRDFVLTRLFPALASRGERPSSMIPDPFMVTDSSLPGAADYATVLNQLVDQYGKLTAQEELLGNSRETVAAAEGKVTVSLRRLESLCDVKFMKRLRTVFAAAKLRKAEEAYKAAQAEADGVQSSFDGTVASLKQVESTASSARATWDRGRPFRDRKAVAPAPMIERDTLLVMFFDSAKPRAIRRLLKRYGLEVLGGTARLSLFVVRPKTLAPADTDDGAVARLHALAEMLRNESIVEAAVQNMQLEAATVAPILSTVPMSTALTVSRFPEAWEHNRSLRATRSIDVGVLDLGFELNVTDVQVLPLPGRSNQTDPHGTHVAAIIGARHGNAIGIDGAAPDTRIFGAAPRGALFDEFTSLLDALLAHTPALRVINASVAYNWGSGRIHPVTSEATRTVVTQNGKIVRKAMLAAGRTVLVAAAGNDCRDEPNCNLPATWASPYTWAALGPESEDEGDQSPNVIVVEGLNADGTRRLPMSNVGGTIRAVGEAVLTIAESNMLTRQDGTSAAAPLVTSAIALMLQVNPDLTVDEIKAGLGIGGRAVPSLNAEQAVRKAARASRRMFPFLSALRRF